MLSQQTLGGVWLLAIKIPSTIIQEKPKSSHALSQSLTVTPQINTKFNRTKTSIFGEKKTPRKKMFLSLQLYSSNKTLLALSLSPLFLLLFSLITYNGCFVEAHVFIYAGCSQEKYNPNSAFEANRNTLLASVVSSSSQAAYNSFAIGNGTSTPSEANIYGLYQCRGDLTTSDCPVCIQSAVNQIGLVCPYCYGASLQLEACYVRYEHTDFLGKLDTSVRHCTHVNSRRDDVLADFETAIGFKVSSSGLLEGFAQFLVDLSPNDCTTCLAESVAKLKNLCGSAAAADVFLAQCYARYWASGYYDFSGKLYAHLSFLTRNPYFS